MQLTIVPASKKGDADKTVENNFVIYSSSVDIYRLIKIAFKTNDTIMYKG